MRADLVLSLVLFIGAIPCVTGLFDIKYEPVITEQQADFIANRTTELLFNRIDLIANRTIELLFKRIGYADGDFETMRRLISELEKLKDLKISQDGLAKHIHTLVVEPAIKSGISVGWMDVLKLRLVLLVVSIIALSCRHRKILVAEWFDSLSSNMCTELCILGLCKTVQYTLNETCSTLGTTFSSPCQYIVEMGFTFPMLAVMTAYTFYYLFRSFQMIISMRYFQTSASTPIDVLKSVVQAEATSKALVNKVLSLLADGIAKGFDGGEQQQEGRGEIRHTGETGDVPEVIKTDITAPQQQYSVQPLRSSPILRKPVTVLGANGQFQHRQQPTMAF